MLNKVFCLQEECYICRIERGIPLGHEGTVDHGTGGNRWIQKACLEALLSRQLELCCAGEVGVRVLGGQEDCACGCTHSSCEPWLHVSLPATPSGTSPHRRARATATAPELRHLLLRVCSTMDSPRMLQRVETLKELL